MLTDWIDLTKEGRGRDFSAQKAARHERVYTRPFCLAFQILPTVAVTSFGAGSHVSYVASSSNLG